MKNSPGYFLFLKSLTTLRLMADKLSIYVSCMDSLLMSKIVVDSVSLLHTGSCCNSTD